MVPNGDAKSHRRYLAATGLAAGLIAVAGLTWTFPTAPDLSRANQPEASNQTDYRAGGAKCDPAALQHLVDGRARIDRRDYCAEKAEERAQNTNNFAVAKAGVEATQKADRISYQQVKIGWFQTLLVMFAFGASAWAAWAASRAARAADDTLNHARETAERQLRAYISPSTPTFIYPQPGIDGKTVVKIVNDGATPARDVEIFGGYDFRDYSRSPVLTLNTDMIVSKFDLGPGQSINKIDVIPPLNPQQAHEFSCGIKAMYVHGEVRYRDVFDVSRVTYYRFIAGGDHLPHMVHDPSTGVIVVALDAHPEGNHST